MPMANCQIQLATIGRLSASVYQIIWRMLKSSRFVAPILLVLFAVLGAGTARAVTWIDGSNARLQALDKITARISTVETPVGAARFFGTLEITVNRCAFHPPEEPPENAAFITVLDRGYDGRKPQLVFSGWVFSSSPAVSALEHPVYDLTLLACFNK
jgi:hypothetical protein